jgi:hypothetical protein
MPDDDEAMLAAYNETLAHMAELLKQLGVKDGEQATEEQAKAAIRQLFDEMFEREGVFDISHLTTDQIMADHRKLSRLKRQRQH